MSTTPTNHPLFGVQPSLILDRIVVINVDPAPNKSFVLRQTDMSGRSNKRHLKLADAETEFVTAVVSKVSRPDNVAFDPAVLRSDDDFYVGSVLASLVNRQANLIATRTLRAKGNSVIVSRWALRHLLAYNMVVNEEPAFYPHGLEDSGLVYMGAFNGINVYLLPGMPATMPLLVSYTSPTDQRDAGAFIAHVSGMYHVMTPDNDPPEVITRWTDYYGIVPVIN